MGLDLEIGAVAVRKLAVAQLAAELLRHLVTREIGDVAQHAGKAQSTRRHDAMLVEVAAMEIGVGQDGLPRHLVEGDVLRRQFRRRGDHQRMADAIRVLQRPFQRLHAADGTADDRGPRRCRDGRRDAPARRPSPSTVTTGKSAP